MARETELELLKQECTHLKDQMNRLISHVESEQRVYGQHGKRIDQQERTITNLQTLVDKLDNILRNGNGGMQLRVDRLEQREKESRLRLTMWLSIASGAVGLLSLILQMTRS